MSIEAGSEGGIPAGPCLLPLFSAGVAIHRRTSYANHRGVRPARARHAVSSEPVPPVAHSSRYDRISVDRSVQSIAGHVPRNVSPVKRTSASSCHHLLKTVYCGVGGWRERHCPTAPRNRIHDGRRMAGFQIAPSRPELSGHRMPRMSIAGIWMASAFGLAFFGFAIAGVARWRISRRPIAAQYHYCDDRWSSGSVAYGTTTKSYSAPKNLADVHAVLFRACSGRALGECGPVGGSRISADAATQPLRSGVAPLPPESN
jgi:hypothetical protein